MKEKNKQALHSFLCAHLQEVEEQGVTSSLV
jgi:hypothetical protein